VALVLDDSRADLLEAEVVAADGDVKLANACANPDPGIGVEWEEIAHFFKGRGYRPNLTISLATPRECCSICSTIFAGGTSEPAGNLSTLSA
jgi:hypothetical protein